MCNCFSPSPTTFFPPPSSFTYPFTTSKSTHKSLGIYRILSKSNSSNGYDFFDKEETEIEIPLISSPGKEIDDDRGVGFLEFHNKLEKGIVGRKKEMMKRSNLIAKQVITIHSALSLGFVSQLWVDINSWIVFLVEVRPNLLSGEGEKFLLGDVKQVGDVVLVEDESVMENEFKLVGLQTLVGYNVVTPRQRNIGKVRGYTFNINSGAVDSLELDGLGISIIPSSLVSTYGLFVEDVVDVLSDTIVVHEAGASRLQRLTTVLWSVYGRLVSVSEVTVSLMVFFFKVLSVLAYRFLYFEFAKVRYRVFTLPPLSRHTTLFSLIIKAIHVVEPQLDLVLLDGSNDSLFSPSRNDICQGFWDAQDYSNLRNSRPKQEYGRSRKRTSAKKLRKKVKEFADDLDLPMDFF